MRDGEHLGQSIINFECSERKTRKNKVEKVIKEYKIKNKEDLKGKEGLLKIHPQQATIDFLIEGKEIHKEVIG
jgi:hypothetical protein